MDTRIDEIEDRLDRISTFVPEIAAPAGFTCNQFLLDAGEPLLVTAACATCSRRSPRPSPHRGLRLLQPGCRPGHVSGMIEPT